MNEDERVAPVKEGEIYEVTINSVGSKGDGIAKVKGFVLFVANTKKGDQVKIKVTKILKNAGFAEVVGKSERTERRKKFETINPEELKEPEEQPATQYKDTEDFGEDLAK